MSEKILESQLFEIINDEEMAENIKLAKIDMLIKLGVDVNAKLNRKSALIWAKENKAEQIYELLEKNGAKEEIIPASQYELWFDFTIATINDNVKKVEELINEGLDVNAYNKDNVSCMTFAALKGNKDIMELLIKNGGDVNLVDRDGIYVIETAIAEGNEEVVKALVENGADIHRKNKFGISPMQMMKASSYDDIKKLVLDKKESVIETENEKESIWNKIRKNFSRD